MNLATVSKQQTATRFNNQDETPLAFAANSFATQRASLTQQADTVSFSSQAQTQPQFGLSKWWLTPLLPLFIAACGPNTPGNIEIPECVGSDCPTNPNTEWSSNFPVQPYGKILDYTSELSHLDGYPINLTATIPDYPTDIQQAVDSDLFKTRVLSELKINGVVSDTATVLPQYIIDLADNSNLQKAAGNNPVMLENFITAINAIDPGTAVAADLALERLAAGDVIVYFNGQQPQGISGLSGAVATTHLGAGPNNEDIIVVSADFQKTNGNNMMGTIINELLETDASIPKNRAAQLTDLYITRTYNARIGASNFPLATLDGSSIGLLNTDETIQNHLNGALKEPVDAGLQMNRYFNDNRSVVEPDGLNTAQEQLEEAVSGRTGTEPQPMNPFSRSIFNSLKLGDTEYSGEYGTESVAAASENLHTLHDNEVIRERMIESVND